MDSRPAPVEAIVALLQALVRIGSRAGEDPPAPVLACIEGWFDANRLAHRRIEGVDGQPLGLYAEVRGQAGPGRWTVLDATLDTAGFGDPASWSHPPTSASIDAGWLHGRGSADSKAGVVIFAHLLQALTAAPRTFAGRVGVLFDLDEHSGRFGGARAFFDSPFGAGPPPRPDGVVIGYPGIGRIVTGGRGFLRARLRVPGVAAHAGASRARGVNAIDRALALAQALRGLPLPPADEGFALAPQLTLTGIRGGSQTSFSQVPDVCEIGVDIRLTPGFGDAAARAAVERLIGRDAAEHPAAGPTAVEWYAGWPAYRVADDDPLVGALRAAARAELGHDVPTAVVGPSNIGNYVATLGVPALGGFGVREMNLHAADERIELASIAPVWRIYRGMLARLHAPMACR